EERAGREAAEDARREAADHAKREAEEEARRKREAEEEAQRKREAAEQAERERKAEVRDEERERVQLRASARFGGDQVVRRMNTDEVYGKTWTWIPNSWTLPSQSREEAEDDHVVVEFHLRACRNIPDYILKLPRNFRSRLELDGLGISEHGEDGEEGLDILEHEATFDFGRETFVSELDVTRLVNMGPQLKEDS
ncbi:unnamed protein product, partial [Amoebophrya sp. A25]